ncbi:MAG: AMIN domain-containing protein, partial [Thiohalorhabdus sp.]
MVPWRMRGITAVFLLAAMQALTATAAAAAVQVEQVELYQEGDTTGVLLAADGELKYSLLSQQDPPRVLVQLPEAKMGPEVLPAASSKGLVRNLEVHRGDGKPPRLELILAGPAQASATREGTALQVALAPKTSNGSGRALPTASGSGPEATAGDRLRDYAVSRSDSETSLTLKTGGPVQKFQSFQLDEPNRLVVDLYGVELALPRTEYPLDHPFINRIVFGQHGDRTRMVLRLREQVTHSVEPSNQGLQVALTRPSSRDALRRVTDVDFTTGPQPEVGRVTLELDRTGAEPQVHREENRVVLDLPKTRLPQELEKRLVVTDFGTAVETVDLYQKDQAVRVVATGTDGLLQAQTYQVEDRLVLDVSGAEEAEPAKRGPKAAGEPYEGEKLSLNFQDIQVRQALQILAEFADLNIIASESVSGTLTLRLQDVPWDQALDLILDSQGLGMERQGNVIRVAAQAELRKQREEQLKAELQKQQLVPLQTEMIPINYAKASELKSLLEAQAGEGGQSQGSTGVLSQRGSVTVDARTNTLIVRDTPEQIRKIKDLVEKLDRPTKQVMIEARIVKIDTNFERNLG